MNSMIDNNYTVSTGSKKLAKEKILLLNKILSKNKSVHHGFLGGTLGLLYYYYHAFSVLHNNVILEEAKGLLEEVFDDINTTGRGMNGPLFGNGAAGFAFTVNYLQENGLIDFDVENELEEIEEYLFHSAKDLIVNNDIDFLHGALGIVHYFITRAAKSTKIKEYLIFLIDQICAKAIADKDGIWFKNYSLDRLKGNSMVDLGLAHGLSGILLILIKAHPFLDTKEQLEQVIKKGIRYILSNQIPIDTELNEYSYFPCTMNNESKVLHRLNRLAWCYGDINEVLLLYRAGKLFGDSYYTEKADEIGFKSIERKTEETTLCKDTHFCHGSAGLAQFYKCLYRESGQHKYYQTYEFWINYTIAGIDKEIATNAYSANPVGLLEGWAGVALVLTEYISEGPDTNWAKAFLL